MEELGFFLKYERWEVEEFTVRILEKRIEARRGNGLGRTDLIIRFNF